jgi:hypothetical protein
MDILKSLKLSGVNPMHKILITLMLHCFLKEFWQNLINASPDGNVLTQTTHAHTN